MFLIISRAHLCAPTFLIAQECPGFRECPPFHGQASGEQDCSSFWPWCFCCCSRYRNSGWAPFETPALGGWDGLYADLWEAGLNTNCRTLHSGLIATIQYSHFLLEKPAHSGTDPEAPNPVQAGGGPSCSHLTAEKMPSQQAARTQSRITLGDNLWFKMCLVID